MKKLCSALLVLSLLFSLTVPALAADPAPPEWCPAEEYAVFAGSAAYEAENWEALLSLREHARAGGLEPESRTDTVLYNRLRSLKLLYSDPGVQFELGLLDVKFSLNAAAQGKPVSPSSHFEFAATHAEGPEKYLCQLWNARVALAGRDITTGLEEKHLGWYAGAVEPLLREPQFDFSAIYTCPLVQTIPSERLAYAKSLIFVTLDGELVHPRSVRVSPDYVDTTTAQTRNWRTMVPVRRLAELMGATVEYDAATRVITICRAGDTFSMTLDSTTASRNGVPFEMDAAPYAENNRTYIPIRYIAEFFGQKVEWRQEQQHVVITEDKSAVGNSNLEAWALAMGALLNYENNPAQAHLFGGKARFGAGPVGGEVTNLLETTGPDFGRQILSQEWSITKRETLTAAIDALAAGQGAWDWFRASHLAQWGYLAGYLTYSEALELVEPAARQVHSSYGSWREAYEAYLKGYCAWSGLDTADVWTSERGLLYETMLAAPAMTPLLNDALFDTGVIGLTEASKA